mgnify:CR=1 FL=1
MGWLSVFRWRKPKHKHSTAPAAPVQSLAPAPVTAPVKVSAPAPAPPPVARPVVCAGQFYFTLAQMKQIFSGCGTARDADLQAIADELNANQAIYKLDTPLRRTHFFAQVLEEAGPNLRIEENLRYASKGLMKFSYFKAHPEKAVEHGHSGKPGCLKANGQPMSRLDLEAIANLAYTGNSNLGNTQIGDGWRFRGRGLTQLTGRYNYTQLQKWHDANQHHWPADKPDFLKNPDLLLSMKYAVRSALQFWLAGKLFDVAERGSEPAVVDAVTKVINRWTASQVARRNHFARLWASGVLRDTGSHKE